MSKPDVIIIGGGPGGLSAARHLAASTRANVTLIQREGLAQFLPGILPALLGLRPTGAYRQRITLPGVKVVAGEVVRLEAGGVELADGSRLRGGAIIAAPGLVTDPSALPSGPRSFPIWELAAASTARDAIQSLSAGRVVISISSLPYRCPPAPYGLAATLKAIYQQQGKPIEVVLATPEERPLQTLPPQVPAYLEALAMNAGIILQTTFLLDSAASHDGLLVAADGRQIDYDLGLFVPPHRRPAFLADLPGNGALVQVDTEQRTVMPHTWVIGDAAGSPLPRAAGVAEAQGRTAAEAVLASLGLGNFIAPTIPAPNCYVWASPTSAGRIQLRFPDGLPPFGKPQAILDAPNSTIFSEAITASERWEQQLG